MNIKLSVTPQDLSGDKLLLDAPREAFGGQTYPALGGIPLLAKLGQGAMGAVYYGVHPRLGAEVAVKVLPAFLAENHPDLIERFQREARLAARIRCPHLISVTDVNREAGLSYMVMEYVHGRTAGQLLRDTVLAGQDGLPEASALQLVLAAAQGLAAAHAKNVIHRDIKPDNILVPYGNDGKALLDQAKLADLGLAVGFESLHSLTGNGACMGTPGYAAPEQATRPAQAGKPADIFSFGATLYALVTARAPFRGATAMETIMAAIQEPHEPARTYRADLSQATSNLIDRCLSKGPGNRPPDGAALCREIEACLKELSGLTATPWPDLRTPTEICGGSTMAPELPVTPAPPIEATGPRPAGEAQPVRILVVEDDNTSRLLLVKVLENAGYPVAIRQAANGKEAMKVLQSEGVDLLFSDVCMAGSDGFELLDWLRGQSRYTHLPVILVTAIPESVGKERGYICGADAYLQKPIDRDNLKMVLGRMIRRVRRASGVCAAPAAGEDGARD